MCFKVPIVELVGKGIQVLPLVHRFQRVQGFSSNFCANLGIKMTPTIILVQQRRISMVICSYVSPVLLRILIGFSSVDSA